MYIVIYDSKVSVWYFQAEELIKREMITMLHYDAVYSPPVIPAETKKRGQVTSQAQHLAYLEQHPYETYSQDQVAQVCNFFPQTKEQ
jgi:pre-mRNA-splicing factor CDC5/CEF1